MSEMTRQDILPAVSAYIASLADAVQEFFDTYFPDSYLDFIFPHMQYVGKPEQPVSPPQEQ